MAAIIKPLIFLLPLLSFAAPLFESAADFSPRNLDLHDYPPLADGLSWDFYDDTCPKLESIVRSHLRSVFAKDGGLAAGILRVFQHDCFVQGCDGSVLLAGSGSEQEAPPNLTLRPEAFAVINDLRRLVEDSCGLVVSCADITALAARDAVFLSGGPRSKMPLGRRDALAPASNATTISNIPSPRSSVTTLRAMFKAKELTLVDLVALSGAHTIGVGHCASFADRLYPTQDPALAGTYARQLYATCPNATAANTTAIDARSPGAFDNKYFVGLVNGEGLFASDQGLFSDRRTRETVKKFVGNQKRFFGKFVRAFVKMSQLNVLSGSKGEIRRHCAVPNSATGAAISAM